MRYRARKQKHGQRAPGTAASLAAPRGWHSRGYLPHLDAAVTQIITYRLADGLPRSVVLRCLQEGRTDTDRRRRMEEYLDAGQGSCVLRQPEAAAAVEGNWMHFDGERYDLLAWVVMPNHVHVLIDVYPSVSLSRILDSWKSYTSNEINRRVGRSGKLWADDYWDRFVRDERHFVTAVDYIHENPVKAGLARCAEDWLWSSARLWSRG